MKRVLFLVHGIGKHETGWSKSAVKLLQDAAAKLSTDSAIDFDAQVLKDNVKKTEFVEILYDDLYQKFVKVMFEREDALIAGLKEAGLPGLAKLFTTDSAEKNLLRDHVFDIVIYRAMKEHRFMTRKHVALQIYQKLRELGVGDNQYSILAHSMGTAVVHDTLEEMSTESGSPYRLGFPFKVLNVFMVANTSALLRNDYDPRESNVRPFIATGDPGYVYFYYDFAHEFDPVARFYSYREYMETQPKDRLTFVPFIKHFKDKNIHALTHYLEHPAVYLHVFQGLYGKKVVPRKFIQKATSSPPQDTLADTVKSKLLEGLKGLVKDGKFPQLDGRSNALLSIASALKELL